MRKNEEFDRNEFENKLRQALNTTVNHATTLKKSMEYSLLSPGKRIRPQLVYEAATQLGLSNLLSDPVAVAIEMVHAFSLIHDDLPCMDDDDFRRGLPTNHKIFGEPVALLAGDALLTQAFMIFGTLAERVNPATFAQAFQLFSQCIGSDGIMLGQALELELFDPKVEHLLHIQNLKTTKLFQAAVLIPVLLAGYEKNHPIFNDYLKFANAFGFAFQVADDLADAEQDAGKKNLLSFLSKKELIEKAKRQLSDSPLTAQLASGRWLLAQF